MEVHDGPVPGHVLERAGRHRAGPGHDGAAHRRPHGAPRPRRLRHGHAPRRPPLRARPAPGPLPALRRQGQGGHPVPARRAPQHPRPDDRSLRVPQGIHPLLAQLRPGGLPALLQRMPHPGLLRRRHPFRLRPVPPRRQGRHHLRAHEAPALRHQQERQLPPQRALHHGRRGARRLRVSLGGRARVRCRGAHGQRRLRHPGRRARAPGFRQDPQRMHRQAAARSRAQARRRRPAHGRRNQAHHCRRSQDLRRDGFRRQRPARAARRRVGRQAHRRREGGEADAGAVGPALGGHEVRPGQGRRSLQVKSIQRASEILSARPPCQEPSTVNLCVRAELHQCVVRTLCHHLSSGLAQPKPCTTSMIVLCVRDDGWTTQQMNNVLSNTMS